MVCSTVVKIRVDVHRGILRLILSSSASTALSHGHVRGALGLEHAEGGRGAAVEPRDGAHLGDAVVHVREYRAGAPSRPPGSDDLRVAEVSAPICAPPSTRMACSPPPTWARPPAASRLRARSCSLTCDRGEAQRLHARRIELDADLAVHAAAARHLRDARERQQALGDRVVDEPAQLCGRQVGGGDRVEGEGAAVDVHRACTCGSKMPCGRSARTLDTASRTSVTARSIGVPIWNSHADVDMALGR